MSKGIIYVMTTVVPGLIKIGKTGSDNFEQRMYHLERNGYSNVVGLNRKFAIEVEDYDDKEKLIDEIFSKSRVPNTELFALDIDLVVQLLSSLEGKQIYPKETTKEQSFDQAVKEMEVKGDSGFLPDGIYYLERSVKGFGKTTGKAIVEDGIFTVLKGSICGPIRGKFVPEIRKNAKIENHVLMEDVICSSPSAASWLVIGNSSNGWVEWKDEHGNRISKYRKDLCD